MRLADFIARNIGTLLTEWHGSARSRLPGAYARGEGRFRAAHEALLSALAADLRRLEPAAGAQAQRPRAERQASGGRGIAAAEEHAAERLRAGFTLEQLVAEYEALRASVIRCWRAESGAASTTDLDDVVRFNEAVDGCLALAIDRFNGGVERSRDVFVGMLGHDLRDPLSAALAAAEMQLHTEDIGRIRHAAKSVRRNLMRMSGMISDLLDFARTRLGERLPIHAQPTDLERVCRSIAEQFSLSHNGREVRLDCAGDLRGTWDPDRVEQLLSNLVKNALEHGSAEGPVTVHVRGEADGVVLAVHNVGAPVPVDRHDTLFDPLARGEDGANSHSGLGLGLYIVKEIAEGHGGSVELDSSAERGTTFTCRLPRSLSVVLVDSVE